MTSKQVLLIFGLAVVTAGPVAGCGYKGYAGRDQRPTAPYPQRQVWAVAPLRNESGSEFADGVRMADHLTHELTLVTGIDTIPTNRTLAVMTALKLTAVTSKAEALALRQALGVDGLVVGTLTGWEPYDPPKMGVALELYLDPVHASRNFDTRQLTGAATGDQTLPPTYSASDQPVSAVAAYYDAADPIVRQQLDVYGENRGINDKFGHNPRLYRISMDLYGEFVSHQISSRLLHAERVRRTPPPPESKEPQTTRQPTPGQSSRTPAPESPATRSRSASITPQFTQAAPG